MWAYGWGWAKTAGSNLECRMQYSLEIALFLPPLSHICAPQSEFIWFSLLPSPLFPPNREATKTVLLFLYPYPFVHLPQHFYHRVISGEGHFTLCPTMGIKEGKTISHKDIACDDCFGENILLLFPTRITDKFYLKYKIKVFLSFYLCIPYLGNRIISCHDLCFLWHAYGREGNPFDMQHVPAPCNSFRRSYHFPCAREGRRQIQITTFLSCRRRRRRRLRGFWARAFPHCTQTKTGKKKGFENPRWRLSHNGIRYSTSEWINLDLSHSDRGFPQKKHIIREIFFFKKNKFFFARYGRKS